MPLSNGADFAGYRIIRMLGFGGMGEVYLVQHPRLPRRDALKLLPREWSGDPQYRSPFSREADLASTLWHPSIVGVHDRGEHDGQLWIAMDFVDGQDLGLQLSEKYPAGIPSGQAVPIVAAVASALDHAHKRGLLHRDVRPADIMLADPGDDGQRRVLLADSGIDRTVDDTLMQSYIHRYLPCCAPLSKMVILSSDNVKRQRNRHAKHTSYLLA